MPIVAIVDDDESVRESLPDLVREFGYEARAFASAEDFLASDALDPVACVLLDIAMPGMSGLELFRELRRRANDIPVVFVTARCDEMTRARLVREGAVACLFKPFAEADLAAALRKALGAA